MNITKITCLVTIIVLLLTIPGRTSEVLSSNSEVYSSINAERANAGLPPLSVDSRLESYAKQHTAYMIKNQTLEHSTNLSSMLEYYEVVGENVGRGPSWSSIHDAFMDSSSHRANILDPRFTHVGAWIEQDDGGRYYVTQVFGGNKEKEPAPEPAPEPTATKEPQPEPSPTSAPVEPKKESPKPVESANLDSCG